MTNLNLIKIFVLEDNIELGENINIGKNVTIKTTNDGKFFLEDGITIDDNAFLYAQFWTMVIGSNSYIGIGCHIVACERIKIGERCLITAYTIIRDGNHGMEYGIPIAEQKQTTSPIVIGNDVWLGSHVVVTADSKIGNGCMISTRSKVF